jgi:CheY-like chemotaxis protein
MLRDANSPASRKRILLIAAPPDQQTLLRWALEESGIDADVVTACTTAEAIDLLEQGEQPYDLMALDLGQSGEDGLKALARVRSDPRTEFVPFVLLLESPEQDGILEAYRLGANNGIVIDDDPESVRGSVRLIFGYWLGADRERPEPSTQPIPAIRLRAGATALPITDLLRVAEGVFSRLQRPGPRNVLLDGATALVLLGEHVRPYVRELQDAAMPATFLLTQMAGEVLADFARWIARNAEDAPLTELRARELKALHVLSGVLVTLRETE